MKKSGERNAFPIFFIYNLKNTIFAPTNIFKVLTKHYYHEENFTICSCHVFDDFGTSTNQNE